jgi:polysaccharide export outer membrane protein
LTAGDFARRFLAFLSYLASYASIPEPQSMRTLCADPARCRNLFAWARSRACSGAIAVSVMIGAMITSGCAATETRYAPKELPAELQASRWQAPCTVDLTPSPKTHLTTQIESGDQVEVLVATGLNSSQMARIHTTVAADGTVELPVLGRIPVAGVTPDASHQAVVQACYREGVSAKPLVQVSLEKPRQHRVIINGAVSRPGVYMLSRENSDLVSALAAAGGLSKEAGEKIVIQSRHVPPQGTPSGSGIVPTGGWSDDANAAGEPKEFSVPADRREIPLTPTSTTKLASAELHDGDVVTVERRDPPSIVVTGIVNRPGRYDLPIGQELRILDAIAMAHGVSYKVLDRVMVCRKVRGNNERAVIEVNLREATRNQTENILLMGGDVVSVEANAKVLFQDTIDYIGAAILGFAPAVIH